MKTALLTGIELAHQDDHALYVLCEIAACKVADDYKLDLKGFEHKRRPSPDGAIGLCDLRTNVISIVFRFRALQMDGGKWWKKRLSLRMILETIAHELAHLRHDNHGTEFKEFERELIPKVREAYHNITRELPTLHPYHDPVHVDAPKLHDVTNAKRANLRKSKRCSKKG